jgi:tetratricopeptide (TPR) repeat protein
MRSHAVPLALALVALGCASANLARRYEDENRWEDAYQQWARVAASPGLFTSDATLAVYHYNLARAAGVTCRWDEAVKEFQIACELDRASGGRSDMDLLEQAELYAHREDWQRAVEYYERGFADLNQRKGLYPHPSDQVHLWNKYARALREVGRRADAETYYQKADELAARPGVPRDHAHWTLYGSECAAGLAQR